MNNFLVYIIFSVILFLYNYICYKRKKVVYTLNKKQVHVLDYKFYDLQFKVWNIIVVIFVLIAIMNIFNTLRFMPPIFLIIASLSFWIINLILKDISYKRDYIKMRD